VSSIALASMIGSRKLWRSKFTTSRNRKSWKVLCLHLISDHIIRRHPSKNDTNMGVAEENLNAVMTDKHKQGPTFLKLQQRNSQLSAQMQQLNREEKTCQFPLRGQGTSSSHLSTCC
jgi:hypothetical protein